MNKHFGSDKSISLILRIALVVIIICVGATFLHVFDIKNTFENNTRRSYEGHVSTAVAEISYQVNVMRNIMDSYAVNMAGVTLNEEINEVLKGQQEYSQGYKFYYLSDNGVLVSTENNEYNGELFAEIKKQYFTNDFTCIPAVDYFGDEYSDAIIAVKRIPEDENGNYHYLIILREMSRNLNLDTFNYLNELGVFILMDGSGNIIAYTDSYDRFFKGYGNFFEAITDNSSKSNNAYKHIAALKKGIFTKVSYDTSLQDNKGEDAMVYVGQIQNAHDLYYAYYFDPNTMDKYVKGSTVKSFLICLFMILIMVGLIIFVWLTLNESNDLITKLAYVDDVTGGYNYNFFRRQAPQIISSNRETPYLMLRFDIMNFRYINESYGHDRADKVLMATIKQFNKVFDNKMELCVRVNSDQFVALVKNDQEYEDKYMRYLKGISDEASEVMIKFPIRLKVGMYQIRKDDMDIDLMIDRANAARKSIDVTANSFSATYSDSIIKNMRMVDAIESEMEKSLKQGEFRVFIQPKWDIVKDEIMGGEALVRWIKNDGTMVYPSDFIPVFESNGFIENLDFYMLEQLCIKMREMKKSDIDYKFFPISVNQSRVLINNPDYVKNVEKVIKRYEIDVNNLQLEITENLFFDQQEKMVEVVNQLKGLGLELAMDDFGSGYSSLNILKDVPFDILKIDKDFFDESIISNASTVILRKILEMAEELGIDVICEGVETKEQVEMLKGFGCHAVQGYFYGKPMPVDEFIENYCLK